MTDKASPGPKEYVVDTSIVIERKVTEMIKKKEIEGRIIIPYAVLAELEHQANTNQTEGFIGLEEIKELRELAEQKKISLLYAGKKPTELYIKGARAGAIDDLIRDLAQQHKAILLTADRAQSIVAEAMGLKTILMLPVPIKKVGKLDIEKFFDKNTMSIHLKENTIPYAKKGRPGDWRSVGCGKKKLTSDDLKAFTEDVVKKVKLTPRAFTEISSPGMSVIQFKDYRIIICKPPFADGWEMTAARPLISLEMKDYRLSNKLFDRLKTSAAGILVSGAPGSGKTTFAAALAKFYSEQSKVVKTIESPRDMVVPDEIVQYSKNFGNRDDIHTVLLLTRPDYTIFDEMRTTDDFRLYTDLRLAGIGLVGVIHSTEPIDAVQRFLGRVDLGVIPQIIDTIVFIKDGSVGKCLELTMKVKVPTGMTEADLARPVIEVQDFETQTLEYEVYSYGEQTVVIPVKKRSGYRPYSLSVGYRLRESKKSLNFYLAQPVGKVMLRVSGREIATLNTDQGGEIRIHKKSKLGRRILGALRSGDDMSFVAA